MDTGSEEQEKIYARGSQTWLPRESTEGLQNNSHDA